MLCYVADKYLFSIKEMKGKTVGRMWWTGRSTSFANIPLGKNELGKVPHLIAEFLKLPKPEMYTFHSFIR